MNKHVVAPILLALSVTFLNPATAGPAPGLSAMGVDYVLSAQHPALDKIPPYALITPNDHGGAWVQVITSEIGYGTPLVATLAGARMTLTDSRPLVNPYTRLVYGFQRLWTITGKNLTGGQFVSKSSSIAYPFGTMGTWINIR